MKSPLASKTIWTNLTLILGAIGAYFSEGASLEVTLAVAIPAAVNILLRFLTKEPIVTPAESGGSK